MQALGKELWDKNQQVATVFICFESWMKHFDVGQAISSRPFIDYQDKEEVFCIMGQTINLKVNAAFLKINRPLGKKRIILSSPQMHPYKDSEKYNYKFSSDLLKAFYKGYFEKCANKMRKNGELG